MPIFFTDKDITLMECDAIVNAANNSLLGGGGVDGAIHRAAGPGLLEECRTLHGCETGDAKITGAYDLKAKYIIHTVGPVWQGGMYGEKKLLRSCYDTSFALAAEKECESIAFPIISSGVYGYPKKAALQVALDAARDFLEKNEMTVYLILFGNKADYFDESGTAALKTRIGDASGRYSVPLYPGAAFEQAKRKEYERNECTVMYSASVPMPDGAVEKELRKRVSSLDESFSEMLLRKIDEKGMSDVECYKRANADRKLFSKIRSDRLYRPSKTTAIAFAIALSLDRDETDELLMKAGYALSGSTAADIIIAYFIDKGVWDIMKINEALFEFDQKLLGA